MKIHLAMFTHTPTIWHLWLKSVILTSGLAKFYDFGSMAIFTPQLWSTRKHGCHPCALFSPQPVPSVGTLAQKQLTAGELSLTVVRLCKGDIEQGTFTCWLLIQIRVQALYPTPLNGHQILKNKSVVSLSRCSIKASINISRNISGIKLKMTFIRLTKNSWSRRFFRIWDQFIS